jgi:hypothetical protein
MYCSGCGQVVVPGQGVCPYCQRPLAAQAPLVPGLEFELQNYAGKIRTLSIVWFLYAGCALLSGILALAFARSFFAGHLAPWMHGPFGRGPWGQNGFPFFFGPALLHFVWLAVIFRFGLALAAGWGLMERAPWGRIVAIIAAFLSLLKFPFGTAIGIWTLVVLMGYRNASLYDRL